MATTEHLLSGSVTDLLGDTLDPKHTTAWVETNVDHDVIVDTTTGGSIRVGAPRVTIADDGTFSVSLATTAGATEPPGFQYRFWIEYRTMFGGAVKKDRWNSGWFSLTAAADLKDVVEEQYVAPTWMTTATETLQTYVTQTQAIKNAAAAAQTAAEAAKTAAQAAQAAAELAAQAAVDISNISTSDDVVSALILGTGGAGPKTRAALKYWP